MMYINISYIYDSISILSLNSHLQKYQNYYDHCVSVQIKGVTVQTRVSPMSFLFIFLFSFLLPILVWINNWGLND